MVYESHTLQISTSHVAASSADSSLSINTVSSVSQLD